MIVHDSNLIRELYCHKKEGVKLIPSKSRKCPPPLLPPVQLLTSQNDHSPTNGRQTHILPILGNVEQAITREPMIGNETVPILALRVIHQHHSFIGDSEQFLPLTQNEPSGHVLHAIDTEIVLKLDLRTRSVTLRIGGR